jgi:hypothetical protein
MQAGHDIRETTTTTHPPDEIARLREQLAEARETLRALADGKVDALVMAGPRGTQRVYTLESADQP